MDRWLRVVANRGREHYSVTLENLQEEHSFLTDPQIDL